MKILATLCFIGTVGLTYLIYSYYETVYNLKKKRKNRVMLKKIKLSDDPDYEVSFVEQGDQSLNDTLILMHGFTGSKGTWRTVLEQLPESLHVIAVDLPGHGSTTFRETDSFTAKDMAVRVHQFTETLGLRRYHVGGHSLGGAVGVIMAALYPDEVRSLIAICPGIATFPETSEFYDAIVEYQSKKENITEDDEDNDVENPIRKYLIPETIEEMRFNMKVLVCNKESLYFSSEQLAAYLEKRRPYNPAFKKMWKFLQVKMNDPMSNLTNVYMTFVKCPTLVLWGDSDAIVNSRGAEVLHQGIAGSQLVMITSCGHSVPIEKSDVISTEICRFLSLDNQIKSRL